MIKCVGTEKVSSILYLFHFRREECVVLLELNKRKNMMCKSSVPVFFLVTITDEILLKKRRSIVRTIQQCKSIIVRPSLLVYFQVQIQIRKISRSTSESIKITRIVKRVYITITASNYYTFTSVEEAQ